MATRAYICVQQDDLSYNVVYLHYDGYVSHAGKLLKEHYNTMEQANALLSFGNISCLDASLDCPAGHSWLNPVKGHCIFYARDNGEQKQEAKNRCVIRSLTKEVDYVYVLNWDTEIWQLLNKNGTFSNFLTES